MSKAKFILKEFLFVPCLLFVFILMFFKTKYLNSQIDSFDGVKAIFLSVLLLVLLENFLMFDLPNNLIFARTISSLIMMISFFLLTYFLREIKEIIWLVISLFIGTITSYLFQRFIDFRKANLLSVITLIILTTTLITLTYLNVI